MPKQQKKFFEENQSLLDEYAALKKEVSGKGKEPMIELTVDTITEDFSDDFIAPLKEKTGSKELKDKLSKFGKKVEEAIKTFNEKAKSPSAKSKSSSDKVPLLYELKTKQQEKKELKTQQQEKKGKKEYTILEEEPSSDKRKKKK